MLISYYRIHIQTIVILGTVIQQIQRPDVSYYKFMSNQIE
jgi:hypothetical protein